MSCRNKQAKDELFQKQFNELRISHSTIFLQILQQPPSDVFREPPVVFLIQLIHKWFGIGKEREIMYQFNLMLSFDLTFFQSSLISVWGKWSSLGE